MTDKEIVKALKCCPNYDICLNCPCFSFCECGQLFDNAIDLINHQQAEIKRLLQKLQQPQTEAIKEFEKRFEGKLNEIDFPKYAIVEKMLVICRQIMNDTVKEMVGEQG